MDEDSSYDRHPVVSHQLVLLRAVALLHEWGYESVRALPYMSPSGMYWRLAIRALDDADAPGAASIHEQFDGSGHTFHYTSGGCQHFSEELNRDIAIGRAHPEQIARLILEVLPAAQPRPGTDPVYVDWFSQLTTTAIALKSVPFAFDDSGEPRPGWQFIGHPYLRFDGPPQVLAALARDLLSTTNRAGAVCNEPAEAVATGKSGKPQRDELYVLDLCDRILGFGVRQKTFEWLIGDPSLATGKSKKLPLDGYWEKYNLAIEFQEKQHFKPVPFWDQKKTASGMTRGEQRKIYDQRKVEKTVAQRIRLLHIRQDAFPMAKGRIDRDPERDLGILYLILRDVLGPDLEMKTDR